MPKTVMVVDDAESMRGLVSITLNNAGYSTVEAESGMDALEKLSVQPVNMIISDVNMPGMNGIELVKQLKSNPSHKFIPVVMLTTHKTDDMKRQGQAAGAKAWIVKPFKPETILKVVQKIIG